jgi:hypothetical protein
MAPVRTLALSLFTLSLALGCASAVKNNSGGTGGASGEGGEADTGGSGGRPSTGGSPGSGGGGTTGTGGESTATGGSGGSTGGGGGGASPDAAVDASVMTSPDASAGDLGGTLAAHPWVIPCQADWTRAQCCMHYCTCMTTNCPSTAPANCVATCSAAGNNWNLKCRVEQCFEALDPKYPMDKASHCGHAVEKPPKCQGIIP